MTDEPAFAANFRENATTILDETIHRVERIDGNRVVAACGETFRTKEQGLYASNELPPALDQNGCEKCLNW